MRNTLKLLTISWLVVSCNTTTKTESLTDTLIQKPVSESPKVASDTTERILACYKGVLKKDTITLNLSIHHFDVTGDLTYNFFEKDKNHGTIKGKLNGDTLIANYTYFSEGAESTRQVVFLTKSNAVYEGSGIQIEKNGELFFEDRSKLDFSKSIPHYNVACQ